MIRAINEKDGLALALLVSRVRTDHTDNALAFDDFAVLAKFFNGCAHFHRQMGNGVVE